MLAVRATAGFVLLVLLWPSGSAAVASSNARGLPVTEKQAQLHLQGDARTVFAQLGQIYRVRVFTDEEFPAKKLTLRLTEVDFATALELATELANAFWVRLDERTFLIAANTPEKRRQYEPQAVQTFSLAGSSPEELAEVVRLLREVFDMRRIQPDTRRQTFAVRDTPERLALASELVAQLRAEPGEVLVEALLLEVDRERARRLGLLPPQQAAVVHLGTGLVNLEQVESLIEILQPLLERGLIPEAFAGVSLQTLLAALSMDSAALQAALPPFILFGGGATTFAANLPGAALNLVDIASVTRSLRRISVRARHAEEASFFVGELLPVITAAFLPLYFGPEIFAPTKQSPFVPLVPAVQYEELGMRLTVRPYLHAGDEVTLNFKLDLRALTGTSVNTIPVFSVRVLEQTARLKAGETLLLSGFLGETQEKVRQGTPLLGSIPVIGHLFSRRELRRRETELLLLLTPYILRRPLLDRPAPRTLYIGTEAQFSPFGRVGPASTPAAPAQPSAPLPPQLPRPIHPPPLPPTQQPPET